MQKKSVLIIGAGMAGCYLSLYLAKKGFSVHLVEKRENIDSVMKESGRSFNITLYFRGMKALQKISLWDEIKKYAELAEGNVAHFQGGKEQFDRFDNTHEVLYTIHRNSLNRTLLRAANKNKAISTSFHSALISIDKQNKIATFKDMRSGKLKNMSYDILIGADGAHSAVRPALQVGQEVEYSLSYSDWGYKEVWISPSKAAGLTLRAKATHTWPRNNSLLLAFPNPDASSTLMFNLPKTGKESFATLTSEKSIKNFIHKYFPELSFVLPEITESLLNRPLGNFVTIKSSPWYYKDSIVLVGDAAHAVLPFYGQGMCSAFEDCISLAHHLTKRLSNREKVFTDYQNDRKPNTDLLAELSILNFLELRDRSRSERFVIKDKIYTLLHDTFPTVFRPPLYVLIAHGSQPYTKAYAEFKKQEKIARLLGIDIAIALLVPIYRLFNRVVPLIQNNRSKTASSLQLKTASYKG